MAERIASGEIHVEVNDREAIASLRRIDDEFERTMRDIDREEATVEIKGDLDDLKKAVKAADKVVKDYDKRIEAAESNRSKAALRRYREEAAARARLARQELAQGAERLQQQKREHAGLALTEKRLAAIQKRETARERALAAADRRAQAAQRRVEADLRREQRLRDQMAARNERIRLQAERDAERRRIAMEREIAQIPKMQRRYVELTQTLERLEKARRKARGDRAAGLLIDVRENEVQAELRRLDGILSKHRATVPVELNLQPGREAGTRLRGWLQNEVRRNATWTALAAAAGADLGAQMGRGLSARFTIVAERGIGNTLRAMGRGVAAKGGGMLLGGLGRAGGALQNLSNMTVRLGPFTATIRQAFSALALFAPLLLDVVGAMGSLISVTGAATLGVGALAAGFLGGLIPAALGMGLVIKDVVQEFAAVKKATKAYNDAVMKGSDTADKKLKELKATLGNVSDETAQQVASAQNLGKAWDKATAPARAQVWTIIGEGIKTSRALMGDFADQTNIGMKRLQEGTTEWFEALRSPEGRGAIHDMMSNFNDALPSILDGLGDLVGYIGRVGRVASDFLPGLADGFADWADNLNDGASNSEILKARVEGVVDAARDLGRFFMSAGRLMKAFFGGGVGAGQDFITTMSNAMDRWTAFLNTTEGQTSLRDFFAEAVRGTQALYGFLAPIVTSFVRWAAEIAPIARGFMEGAAAVSSFVAELLKITALRSSLTALATTLGVLWGIGKIGAATRAVSGFTAALLGLSRAQRTVAATQAASGIASAAGALPGRIPPPAWGGVGTAAKAAPAISATTKAANGAKVAMAGLGAATLGVSSVWAGAAVAAAALAGGIYVLATRTKEYEKQEQRAIEAHKESSALLQQLPQSSLSLAQAYLMRTQATRDVKTAQEEVNRLEKAGKEGTDEYRAALMNLKQARLNEMQTRQQARQLAQQDINLANEAVNAADKDVAARRRQVAELDQYAGVHERVTKAAREAGMTFQEYLGSDKADWLSEGMIEHLTEYNDGLGALARAEQRAAAAREQAQLSLMNQQRAMRGLVPIAQSAAKAMLLVSRLGGASLTKKIALKFEDPGKAERVAKSTASALKTGVPKSVVTRIVVNSKSAEDAIRRLNRVRLDPKNLRIIESGGQRAINMLERIAGRKLTPKEQRIAQQGGPGVITLLERIIGMKLPNKDFSIRAQDYATSVVGNVMGWLNRIPRNVRINITANSPRIGPLANRARGGLADGTPDKEPKPGLYNRALKDASSKTTARAEGIFKSPRLLVGEERRPEVVISSNPAYRKRNLGFLAQAAAMLGTAIVPAATGLGLLTDSGVPKTAGVAPAGEAAKKLSKGAKNRVAKYNKKHKGKKLKLLDDAHPWNKRVNRLEELQGLWEREVTVREMQVREPDDFLTEKKDAKGEVVGFEMDQSAIDTFRSQLGSVKEAYDQLVNVITELMTAIPQAIAEMTREIGQRTFNIGQLDTAIKTQDELSKSKDKDVAAAAQKRANKYRQMRQDEVQDRGEAKREKGVLVDKHQTASFDRREAVIRRDDYIGQITSLDPNNPNYAPGQQLAQAQAGLSTGGAGGAGDTAATGPSIAQQVAAFQSAILNVRQQYGSNTYGPVDAIGSGVASRSMAVGGDAVAGFVTRALRSGGSRAMRQGAAAARAMAPGGGGVAAHYPGGAMGAGGKTVNVGGVTNIFPTPPADPHTWSRGLEFELGTMGY